jgi:hypothetical protein
LYDRWHDIPPFWGGAKYSTLLGGCSTGIPVKQQNVNRILSAGHCGDNGMTATVPTPLTIGTIVNKNATRDTLLINANTAGRIYTGSTGSNSSLPVKGARSSKVGNYGCTSGVYTGQHCAIKVTALNRTVKITSTLSFKPMVQASQISGKVAAGRGDSGGPVIDFTLWVPMSTKVRGTISAAKLSSSLGPCAKSSECFSTIYYASIIDTMNYYASIGQPITVLTS